MVSRSFIAGIAASLALICAAMAASAFAGQYHVYSCRMPDGSAAPVDGWSGSKSGPYTYAENTCAQGGALIAALGDEPARTANTDLATWAFSAPAGETVAAASLWRAGDADGGAAINATFESWLAGPSNVSLFDGCVYVSGCFAGSGNSTQPFSSSNLVQVPEPNLGAHIYANASCGGVAEYRCPAEKADPSGYAAALFLYAADIVLEQPAGPTAANVAGELASAASVKGASAVSFTATDPGSGVYQAVFSVDGQVVQTSTVDENGGRCRDVGETGDGLPAFLYVQPCLQSVSADVPFDTTKLSNGEHHLVVSVTDAAGNAAPVLDRTITVANPPSPCAAGGASAAGSAGAGSGPQTTLSAGWKGTSKTTITSAFGRRQTVVGRLVNGGGAPIQGAAIEVLATPSVPGGTPVAMASPRTQADGSFTLKLPAALSSRTLCLAYGPTPGGPAQATRTLSLKVHAGIALAISPRVVSVGHGISFRGRLLAGPVPPAGKQLVLEARSAGSGWLEFKVIRTNARGRFRAKYRFKFPGPANYSFRVLSEVESDYPFAAGTSNVVRVYER